MQHKIKNATISGGTYSARAEYGKYAELPQSVAKELDLYADRMLAAYREAYNKALLEIIKVLPTLTLDRQNVIICQWEPNGFVRQPYEIEYKGETVASFFISTTESDEHITTIAVEDLKILYTDDELCNS